MTQTIEQLTAKVAELEEENARLKVENRDSCIGLADYYGKKLAASQEENAHWQKATAENENKWIDACDQLAAEQLNNKLLRDALKMVTNKVCWSVFTDSEETQIEEALSTIKESEVTSKNDIAS